MSGDNAQSAATTANPERDQTQKVWLPELIYEALPYCYILIGFIALFTSLYISEWYWIVPHCTLLTAVLVHMGSSILLKRHAVRSGERAAAVHT